ncbi:hypothetical protein [Streptomyces kanasensis]
MNLPLSVSIWMTVMERYGPAPGRRRDGDHRPDTPLAQLLADGA